MKKIKFIFIPAFLWFHGIFYHKKCLQLQNVCMCVSYKLFVEFVVSCWILFGSPLNCIYNNINLYAEQAVIGYNIMTKKYIYVYMCLKDWDDDEDQDNIMMRMTHIYHIHLYTHNKLINIYRRNATWCISHRTQTRSS